MIVQHSSLGYVLAEANGQVVYTYSKDKKNGAPTCTGCCQVWQNWAIPVGRIATPFWLISVPVRLLEISRMTSLAFPVPATVPSAWLRAGSRGGFPHVYFFC